MRFPDVTDSMQSFVHTAFSAFPRELFVSYVTCDVCCYQSQWWFCSFFLLYCCLIDIFFLLPMWNPFFYLVNRLWKTRCVLDDKTVSVVIHQRFNMCPVESSFCILLRKGQTTRVRLCSARWGPFIFVTSCDVRATLQRHRSVAATSPSSIRYIISHY